MSSGGSEVNHRLGASEPTGGGIFFWELPSACPLVSALATDGDFKREVGSAGGAAWSWAGVDPGCSTGVMPCSLSRCSSRWRSRFRARPGYYSLPGFVSVELSSSLSRRTVVWRSWPGRWGPLFGIRRGGQGPSG